MKNDKLSSEFKKLLVSAHGYIEQQKKFIEQIETLDKLTTEELLTELSEKHPPFKSILQWKYKKFIK